MRNTDYRRRFEPPRASFRAGGSCVALVGFTLAFGVHDAVAYVECGDPPGAATNVTAVGVSCHDSRSFATKVTARGVSRTGSITLPGWHTYYARVRRLGGKYDVRAVRGSKVIRFQYRSRRTAGAGHFLSMKTARAVARRRAREFADPGEDSDMTGCRRWSRRRVDCGISSFDDLDGTECDATVTVEKRKEYGRWYVDWNVRGINCYSM